VAIAGVVGSNSTQLKQSAGVGRRVLQNLQGEIRPAANSRRCTLTVSFNAPAHDQVAHAARESAPDIKLSVREGLVEEYDK